MLRILIAMMAVAVLAVPAMGYGTQWDGSPSGQLEIHLELNCYIQIEWQEIWIVFNGTGDWYALQLANVAYAACDAASKYPTDPWGGDAYYCTNGMYYESGDGAVIFVRSNNDLSMAVTTNGDLTGQSHGGTLDTWFTVCLAPFQIAGSPLIGTVPFAPQPNGGHYLYDATGGLFGHANDNGALPVPAGSWTSFDNWPDQYPFPCVGSQTWTLGSMAPYIEGTIKFLGRVHRHGMADAGDDYKTILDVLFTTP